MAAELDLATTYLGLELRSPVVASASPLNDQVESALQIEAAGAGAIVMPSLFEEEVVFDEIQLNRSLEQGAEQFAEAIGYFPTVTDLATTGDRYVERLARLKAACSVPVIASLNATSTGAWTRYARLIAETGADALELNLYHIGADPDLDAADMERRDLDTISAVREACDIPLAVKLSPYYSAMANFARRARDAGADGLVLFNRFYQPDIDLDTLDVVARVELSRSWELRLPMRWIAILRPQLGPHVALAATSGVGHGTDVVKALLVGADVAMVTSAVLREGPARFATIEAELRAWMHEHEYESVSQLRGSASQRNVEDPSAFERANYMRTLRSWSAPPMLHSA